MTLRVGDQRAFPFNPVFLDPCLLAAEPPSRLDLGNCLATVPEWAQRGIFDALEICRADFALGLSRAPVAFQEGGRRCVRLWDAVEISIRDDGRDLRMRLLEPTPISPAPSFAADLSRPIGSMSWTVAFEPTLTLAYLACGLGLRADSCATARAMRRVLHRTFRRYVDFKALRRSAIEFLAPDPLALSLERRMHGEGASASDFNWIATHAAELSLVAIERPRLLPFLQFAEAGAGRDLVAATERALRKAGMNPSAWKKLEMCGFEFFGEACEAALTDDAAVTVAELANLLDRLQVVEPPPLAFAYLAVHAATFRQPPPVQPLFGPHIPDWYLRALLKEARRIEEEEGEIVDLPEDFELTLRWLSSRPAPPDSNQARAGWRWIVQRARKQFDHNLQCKVPCEEFTHGPFRVVPIRNTDSLRAEGRAMQTCLSSYSTVCCTNMYAVFSVRDALTDERLACFSVAVPSSNAPPGSWRLDQVAGKRNAKVSAAIEEVARVALRRMNGEAAR